MDWSYDLLSYAEQRLFARLSIFSGAWTLEAAEAVVPGGDVAPGAVVDLLSQLTDKSLVVAEVRSGDVLYRLLETIREYARERLATQPERELIERQHETYFLDRSREAAKHLAGGPEQSAWLQRLERERGDVRAVLQRLLARGDGARAEEFCEALFPFWMLQGSLSEGREVLGALLQPAAGVPRSLPRAKALSEPAS